MFFDTGPDSYRDNTDDRLLRSFHPCPTGQAGFCSLIIDIAKGDKI
jgi:hypothetical protein